MSTVKINLNELSRVVEAQAKFSAAASEAYSAVREMVAAMVGIADQDAVRAHLSTGLAHFLQCEKIVQEENAKAGIPYVPQPGPEQEFDSTLPAKILCGCCDATSAFDEIFMAIVSADLTLRGWLEDAPLSADARRHIDRLKREAAGADETDDTDED